MAQVTLQGLTKRFAGGVTAVDALNLDIRDGEFVVFLGPSGCGKTTTLMMIAGLEEPNGGSILFDGREVSHLPPHKRDTAVVFQSYALYPHMSVYDNIAFPLKMRGAKAADIRPKVYQVAATLGIGELLLRRPGQLSGGQRQRVALGRAIVREPKVFLLDEPLSNIDAKLRTQMRGELKRLHYDLGTTFIYVTHDQVEAMSMGDRIVVMNAGALQQYDPPKTIYDHPANIFVASFVGSPTINLFPGRLETVEGELRFTGDGLTWPLSTLTAEERAHWPQLLVLGVRPEDILVTAQPQTPYSVPAIVRYDEPLGVETYVVMGVGAATVTARLTGDTSFAPDERVWCTFRPGKVFVFDQASTRLLVRV